MGDAHDPETYISAVVSVLVMYPVEIIQRVTEPATGLASKLKWLPTIAEVKEACDALGPSWSAQYAMEWERQARKQVADRQQLQIEHQKPRKTYEQMVEECRAVGIMIGKDRQPVDTGSFRKKWGISQEQWDAIPDAKA